MDNVLERVRSIIAETIDIPLQGVKSNSVLGRELGVDSFHIVEIEFELSVAFNVKFYEGTLMEKLQELFGPDALAKCDTLTEFGAQVMRARFPEIDADQIKPGLAILEIPEMFTPATYARSVAELLDSMPTACPNCGGTQLTAVLPSVVSCRACDRQINCPTQEDVLTAWSQKFEALPEDGRR